MYVYPYDVKCNIKKQESFKMFGNQKIPEMRKVSLFILSLLAIYVISGCKKDKAIEENEV